MPLRLLVLQHATDSPPGLFGERFAARGAAVTLLDAARDCALPDDAPATTASSRSAGR